MRVFLRLNLLSLVVHSFSSNHTLKIRAPNENRRVSLQPLLSPHDTPKRGLNTRTDTVAAVSPYKKGTLPISIWSSCYIRRLCYRSFIMALLCAKNRDKLQLLNKRILKFIVNYANASYEELLNMAKTTSISLYSGRNHKMLIVVFKSLLVSAYLTRSCSLFAALNIFWEGIMYRVYLNLRQPLVDSSPSSTKLQSFGTHLKTTWDK